MVSNLFLKFKNILFVKNSTRCYGSNDHFALFGTAQKTDLLCRESGIAIYIGRLVVEHTMENVLPNLNLPLFKKRS